MLATIQTPLGTSDRMAAAGSKLRDSQSFSLESAWPFLLGAAVVLLTVWLTLHVRSRRKLRSKPR